MSLFDSNDALYCDFSHIYANESGTRIDMSDIEGTNGYCSDEAARAIRERIASFGSRAVHVLDNGNYHYMSLFWLEKVREPFDLVVFDRHTDMQKSALLPILSCGGWVLDTLEREDIPLNRLLLIGAPQADFNAADDTYKDRIDFISQDEIASKRYEECLSEFVGMQKCTSELCRTSEKCEKRPAQLAAASEHCEKRLASFAGMSENCDKRLPVYISVDKDVLRADELATNWDSGTMSVECLTCSLGLIAERREIIGLDICGEPDINKNGFSQEFVKSRDIDIKIIEAIKKSAKQAAL